MAIRGTKIKLDLLSANHPFAGVLYKQFNYLHSMNLRSDAEVDTEFYTNILDNIQHPPKKITVPDGICTFNPSGASKCNRELFLKFKRYPKDNTVQCPYHTRWTRNSSLVHEGIQRDFLYMEKYIPNAEFIIHRNKYNKPCWEENVKTTAINSYNGVKYAITGMMDGQLLHKPTGKIVGFEFKTKSNTIAQVGTYLLKDAKDYHKQQCVAYSLLFGIDDYILMYEALAKDGWAKGNDARVDIRTFYYHVTQEDKDQLQQKFIDVSNAIKTNTIPPTEPDRCMFCEYKVACANYIEGENQC